MTDPSPLLVHLRVAATHKPGYYGSTTAVVQLPDRYMLHIHGRRGLVRVPGRSTMLDTGCTYLALPHEWWYRYGVELHKPEEEHAVVVRGNRVDVTAGESRVQIWERVSVSEMRQVWPIGTGCLTARTCLVPRLEPSRPHKAKATDAARSKTDRAKVLIGLGLFAGMRICMHLDEDAPRAAVFADVEEGNCFKHLR